jgi:Mg2+/citrate symporter
MRKYSLKVKNDRKRNQEEERERGIEAEPQTKQIENNSEQQQRKRHEEKRKKKKDFVFLSLLFFSVLVCLLCFAFISFVHSFTVNLPSLKHNNPAILSSSLPRH